MDQIVVTFGTISTAVTFIVTWVKSLLMQLPQFAALTPQQQAIVTQAVAFVAGVAIAVSTQANILATFPMFASVPLPVDYVLTGLACGGGSQLFYVVLAFLSGKVVIPTPPAAQAAGAPPAVQAREGYVPFS